MESIVALYVTLFCLLLTSNLTSAAECVADGDAILVGADQECTLSKAIARIVKTLTVNGKVTITNPDIQISLQDLNVGIDGRITADGFGDTSAGGTKAFGGSYGGRGGAPAGIYHTKDEVIPYGSVYVPTDKGQAGGGTTSSCGGDGGGVIHITLTGTADVNGLISANGDDASGTNCGGGSGGSVYLTMNHFKGQGLISARGGIGKGNGGSGSGGRVFVKYISSEFGGTVVADGGVGALDVIILPKPTLSSNGYYGDSDAPSYAYIQTSTRGWIAPVPPTTSYYLLATYSKEMVITGIATRGDSQTQSYVTKYTIEYHDSQSGSWKYLAYPRGGFSGNTDYSTIVRNDFFVPVMTSKLRIRPQSWGNDKIGLAIQLYGFEPVYLDIPPNYQGDNTKPGAGGPGTVFVGSETSPGIGEVIINNIGKDPRIKMSDDGDEFDSLTSKLYQLYNMGRGRAVQCLHCKKFVAQRGRCEAHIYKYHYSLEQAPFYCSVCLFRCTTRKQLDAHVTTYAPHRQRLESARREGKYIGDETTFLRESSIPHCLEENQDFLTMSKEESASHWLQTSKPKSTDQSVEDDSISLQPDSIIEEWLKEQENPDIVIDKLKVEEERKKKEIEAIQEKLQMMEKERKQLEEKRKEEERKRIEEQKEKEKQKEREIEEERKKTAELEERERQRQKERELDEERKRKEEQKKRERQREEEREAEEERKKRKEERKRKEEQENRERQKEKELAEESRRKEKEKRREEEKRERQREEERQNEREVEDRRKRKEKEERKRKEQERKERQRDREIEEESRKREKDDRKKKEDQEQRERQKEREMEEERRKYKVERRKEDDNRERQRVERLPQSEDGKKRKEREERWRSEEKRTEEIELEGERSKKKQKEDRRMSEDRTEKNSVEDERIVEYKDNRKRKGTENEEENATNKRRNERSEMCNRLERIIDRRMQETNNIFSKAMEGIAQALTAQALATENLMRVIQQERQGRINSMWGSRRQNRRNISAYGKRKQ